MTPMISTLVAAFAAVQAAPADTVVTVLARDGLQTAALIALVVLGAFLVVLLLVLLVLLMQLRKLNGTIRALGDKALDKADPIVERGKGVADNVEFISAAVRTDVERVSGLVKSLTGRLEDASEQMEERIEEFNALMEVVQGEAESLFIGTAATARGVKEGVKALNGDNAGKRRLARGPGGRGDAPASRAAAGERAGTRGPTAAPHHEDEVFLTDADEATDEDDAAGRGTAPAAPRPDETDTEEYP